MGGRVGIVAVRAVGHFQMTDLTVQLHQFQVAVHSAARNVRHGLPRMAENFVSGQMLRAFFTHDTQNQGALAGHGQTSFSDLRIYLIQIVH